MRTLVLTVGLGTSLLLSCGQAAAQYRYVDAKGVTKTTQYKVDVPAEYRDLAVWIGPTGVGKPGLSEEARQTKQRDDEYRRIGEANSRLTPYRGTGVPDPKGAAGSRSGRSKVTPVEGGVESKDLVTMCVAGERRVMTSPGHWTVVGTCPSTPDPVNSTPVLAPR